MIVNAQSQGSAIGRRWVHVERRLREGLGRLEIEARRGPLEAGRIEILSGALMLIGCAS